MLFRGLPPACAPSHPLPPQVVLVGVEEGAACSLIRRAGGGPSSARIEVGAGAAATRHQR